MALVQFPQLSVMLALHQYCVPAFEKLLLVVEVLSPGFMLVLVAKSTQLPEELDLQVMVIDPVAPSLSAGMM